MVNFVKTSRHLFLRIFNPDSKPIHIWMTKEKAERQGQLSAFIKADKDENGRISKTEYYEFEVLPDQPVLDLKDLLKQLKPSGLNVFY